MQKINYNIIYIFYIIVISFSSYILALNGEFLSDDYVHIYFMQKMDNDIMILLKNFYSNWLDVPTTAFYRPLISVTLYIDHLLWGWNPLGYHLTNIIFHTLNGILIFLIALNFHKDFDGSKLIVFLVSLLFVTHPIHPEAVYWIIGRVDSQSAFFYLFSLLLFILYHRNGFYKYCIVSMLSFVAALASKEPTVTLPAILTLYIFYSISITSKIGFFKSILNSFFETKYFWIILILYFILRFYALGTFGGGYSGVSTDFFSTEYLSRWKSLLYLVIPINKELNIHLYFFEIIFSIIWFSIFSLILIKKIDRKYLLLLLFFLVAFLIILVPSATVFYIFDNLEASRFLYLPSAIFFIMLSVILGDKYFFINKIYYLLLNFLLIILVILFLYHLTKNLHPWINSSKEMKFFKEEITKIIDNRKASKDDISRSIVLVGIPDSIHGAQFLRNGYSGLFSEVILGEKINNIVPILDYDLYGVKSVEIKNLLREKKNNELFGIYRYHINSGFKKITNYNKLDLTYYKKNIDIVSFHHLEKINNIFFQSGEQPWIKYKLMSQNNHIELLYFKVSLKYKNKNEVENSLKVYWSDNIELFTESKSMNSQYSNCFDEVCEYIFPISASTNWFKSIKDIYFMLGIPKNVKNGFEINDIDIKYSEDYNKENIIDLKSFDFSLFENLILNEEDNSISLESKNKNEYIKFPKIHIDPISTDFISFDMKLSNKKFVAQEKIKFYWTTSLDKQLSEQKSVAIELNKDNGFNTYYIPLKHVPLWWSIGDIQQLFLVPLYGEAKIEIKNIKIGNKLLVPKLEFSNVKNSEISVNKFSGSGSVFKRVKKGEKIILNYNLNDNSEYSLIISKTPPSVSNILSNSDNYIEKYELDKINNEISIDTKNLNQAMYFLRIINQNKTNNSLTSDTIALLID